MTYHCQTCGHVFTMPKSWEPENCPVCLSDNIRRDEMKSVLQGLLMAGAEKRDQVLDGSKTVSIRFGHRAYTKTPILIGCHLLNWATLKTVKRVDHIVMREITARDVRRSGYPNRINLMEELKKFYPDITWDSPITVIEWD